MTTPRPDVAKLTNLNVKRYDPQVQVGRYRVLSAVPTEPQQQLLQVIIHVTLPEDLQTIRSAVDYLLPRSGYQLVTSTADRDVQQLLAKPLPAVHRQLGPMTLQNALAVLVGSAFQLNIDPVHRTISYQLAPASRAWSRHE
jgi:type IV pili sensor histidine kinase/response regulator